MTETIDQMVANILVHEGGYVNNPADPGGATNYGISLRFLISIRCDVNGDGKIDINDIIGMTATYAGDIYKRQFYAAPHIDTLPPALQPMLFDEGVNFGPGAAIECMQRAINVPADGRIGDDTRSVLNATIARLGIVAVNNKIVDQFVARYEGIVRNNPREAVFLKGWLSRANGWKMNDAKLAPSPRFAKVDGVHWLGQAPKVG